jgi:type I restriction enzyme S subunit
MRFEKSEQDRYGLKYGDLVICEGGEPGRCAIWKDEVPGMKIQKALHRVRINNNYSNNYVYYRLLLAGRNGELSKHFIGSTIKHLTGVGLKQVAFSYPPYEDQQKIAAVLTALDAKIECNNRINAELEAMAKTLYDYWFVQFEFPDENGKPYKSSGGMMVYNPSLIKEIPAGWHTEPLLESCQVVDCLHSKKPDYFFDTEECYLIQLENILDSGQIDFAKKYFVSKNDYETWTSRIEVKKHDVVMTNAGRIAAFAQVPGNVVCGIGRNITAIRPTEIQPNYFFSSLSGSHVQKQILSNLDQGAFFKSFNVKGIKALKLLRPTPYIENEFEQRVAPIIEKRHQLLAENAVLTQLRDWLLPMLMNGQVTVK